ncbi:MAG: carbohydrate binding domain-containing protein [Bacteroidales bacterium]|nr:carbohydrate binding domain-containing protein [Bacteroidales bacterium]
MAAAALMCGCADKTEALLTVDLQDRPVNVPQDLWGIFFEEINHAGDGGIWPEMIYNMGFEEKDIPTDCTLDGDDVVGPRKPNYAYGTVRDYRFHHFDPNDQSIGWTIEGQNAAMRVVTTKPLSEANPHSLEITVPYWGAKLTNEGWNGIPLKEGEEYNFSFFLRADPSFTSSFTAALVGSDGKSLYEETFSPSFHGDWVKYDAKFTSKATDSKVKLVFNFESTGKVWLDYVSLLPEKTFKGHGLREDIAQTLADLKPSFIRWPGGCIVEGMSMENRIKWKETIGDRLDRPGQFDLWGYHNSCAFGYHDFLQFCEDIGASAMYVVNIGLSCMVRNGDYYEMNELGGIIQDILDAIEYAIGDTSTKWGAERAKNGHPDPFPLKYIELGNENVGERYIERYNYVYPIVKAAYPDIIFISNHGTPGTLPETYTAPTEMIDAHYYVNPETFYNTVHLFDNLPRDMYKVYIGEYAVNAGVGSGNLDGALAEAAFMTGIEKNSDLVSIASYAPLLENTDFAQWPTNLIRFKNDQVFGRSSYFVQKMFSENRPDFIAGSELTLPEPDRTVAGKVGFASTVSAPDASIQVKGFTVSGKTPEWDATGSWTVEGEGFREGERKDLSGLRDPGLYIPGTLKNAPVQLSSGGWLSSKESYGDCDIKASVLWEKVFSGCEFRVAVKDDANYIAVAVNAPRRPRGAAAPTGPQRYSVSVNNMVNGCRLALGTLTTDLAFDEGAWHDVSVGVKDGEISCTIDGKEIGKVAYTPLERRFAVSGYDNETGEVIVKVVNSEAAPMATRIQLAGAKEVSKTGKAIVLSSGSLKDDNSFEEPGKVSPVETDIKGLSDDFTYTFEPYSLTILRIKASL